PALRDSRRTRPAHRFADPRRRHLPRPPLSLTVTAAFATSGHAPGGEHPLGLAIDVVPAPGASWDSIDRLARWAEPAQDAPRPPFRWVGYDGDPGHGRGNHLHLSLNRGPARGRRP